MDEQGTTRRDASFPWRRASARALLIGLMLLGTTWLGARLLGVEASFQSLSDQVTRWMPPRIFAFFLFHLQHWAKPLLLVGLASAWLVVGAFLALMVWRRGWEDEGKHGADWAAPAVASALLWLLPVAVFSPVAGLGFAGTRSSGGALRWSVAALLPVLVYGWLLHTQRVQPPVFPSDPSPMPKMLKQQGRREFLQWAGISSLAVAGLVLFTRETLSLSKGTVAGPSGVSAAGTGGGTPAQDTSAWSPAVTPVDKFYVVSKNFIDPRVDVNQWRLNVHGLVDKPMQFAYADFTALPSQAEYVTLECISNQIGGGLISNASWTGVPLHSLIERVGPQTGVAYVLTRSVDGYSESLPMAAAMAPEVLLAYQMNGAPLVPGHGAPLRLLVPGRYGMKSTKWVNDIELAAADSPGYWEQRGWDEQAVVKTGSRIDAPADGARLPMAPITVAGIAFAGERGVQSVEVSADGGHTWQEAVLEPALSAYSWVRWTVAWAPPKAGAYGLQVRATDMAGAVQTPNRADDYPSGATGYDSVTVVVG